MANRVEPHVNGRFLTFTSFPGDIEMSTVWPGGSDQLSWTENSRSSQRFSGGELAEGMFGPVPVWAGNLTEPDPSQDQLSAQGAWREADNYVALDGSGNATKVPDTAVDQAISRGLHWTRPASISSTAVDIDVSQGPVTVGSLLDSWTNQSGQRWGVNVWRQVYAKADDTAPTYQMYPLNGGLGFDLTNYSDTLVGRYFNGTSYLTTTRTAAVSHGHKETIVDLTPRGTLTLAKANAILDNLLSLGVAVPAWTTGIEMAYGELLNSGGVPVALETVQAGKLLRIHGGFELAQRLNGALYIDILIGRTQLAEGLVTISPMQLAGDTLADLLVKALNPQAKK